MILGDDPQISSPFHTVHADYQNSVYLRVSDEIEMQLPPMSLLLTTMMRS